MLENNLTVEQFKAIKELKTKMKKENLVCVETDKTGKFALDTKENYVNKVKKHIEMDEVITSKEVTRIENKLNAHAEHVAKITMAGENTGQNKRIKGNCQNPNSTISSIQLSLRLHYILTL